jgi:hypothetical protein
MEINQMNEDREGTPFSGLAMNAGEGLNPLFGHGNDLLMRAIKAACAPGPYDPKAAVALQPLASTRTATVAAAPLSSPAHPTPLALASFSSPPAAQPLAASPAPMSDFDRDYALGAAYARRLLGLTGTAPIAASAQPLAAHPVHPAQTSEFERDYARGAAYARKLLGK